MELFPATDDDAWTLIKRVIDECDYYLLIIAGKYGSVDPASGLSYTEMEYDYACSVGKPVMAFLHADIGQLKSDLCETTDESRDKLNSFRAKVKKAKHVKLWNSPEELAGQVALTYNKFVRLYPAIGWIRGDHGTTAESLKELVNARSRIEQLESQLNRARTDAPAGTEDLAQGPDEFALTYRVSGQYEGTALYSYKSVTVWIDSMPTWDELFGPVAPQLLQEAEEAVLRRGVREFAQSTYFEEQYAALVRQAKSSQV